MATVYGVEATKIHNTTPSGKADVGTLGGNVRLHYDKYTLTADLSANDIIVMNGLLPKGARVIDAFVKHADLDTTGGTIDFGWAASEELSGGSAVEAADDDGWIANADVATAADTIYASINQANAPGIGKKFSAAVQPQIKIEGDTDATSGDIETFIYYVVD